MTVSYRLFKTMQKCTIKSLTEEIKQYKNYMEDAQDVLTEDDIDIFNRAISICEDDINTLENLEFDMFSYITIKNENK